MKNRQLKKLWPFLCLLTLLIACVLYFVVKSNQLEPLFHFDSSKIDQITLQCSSAMLDISEREEIGEIISLLNEFRYNELKEIPPASGWDYGISFTAGGKDVWIVFTADSVQLYKQGGSSTIYYGPPDHFRPLIDLVNGERNSLTG